MQKGSVPRERLAAIIERVLPEYGGDTTEWDAGQCGRLEAMACDIEHATGMTRQTASRRLYAIRNETDNPTFRTADTILAGLGLTHLWHTELADVYAQAA